ncbi:MAG: glycerate kinase [Clostridia bacterium]|nr:glycerate kinase [Clostridia bacterium]
MKKVVIAPDSFKGTLSSAEVCGIVKDVLIKKFGNIEVVEIPIADGGEGMTDSFLYAFPGSEKIYMTAKSPLGRDIEVYYGIIEGDTAVIEMAAASGITIEEKNDALRASTYGTGEMIKHALDKGIRKFVIGIGGSATTDGGIGCTGALGGIFLDSDGKEVSLCGEGLVSIDSIDLSGLDSRIKECEITVLCDVKNPLYGKNGAAYIYGPQKGANPNMVLFLDSGLLNLAKKSQEYLKKDFSQHEGAGAAGGLGFALVAFFGAELKRGIEAILDITHFEEKTKGADLVITGEGKMDEQSLMGKVPFGIASRSKGEKTIAIVGLNMADMNKVRASGISEVIETNPEHLPFDEIKANAKEDLALAVEKIIL